MTEITEGGTLILVDGGAGAGGSTFLSGMPKPIYVLDTDNDSWRWLRDEAAVIETTRNMLQARSLLEKWAKLPLDECRSIAVDTWSVWWQMLCNQVVDKDERQKEFKTTNAFKAWGPAKMAMGRMQGALLTAKARGKHVGLRAHSKDHLVQDETGRVIKVGIKPDCEQFLDMHLDAWFRLDVDKKTDKRTLVVQKCRAARRDPADGRRKPIYKIGSTIDVPEYESDLMYAKILADFGKLPASLARDDMAESETSAESAMREVANV